MSLFLTFCYLSVGFFIAGIYSGAYGKIGFQERAAIVLLWLPGIFYALGYNLGRQSRQVEERES